MAGGFSRSAQHLLIVVGEEVEHESRADDLRKRPCSFFVDSSLFLGVGVVGHSAQLRSGTATERVLAAR